ncbi:MAG: adenylate/guanylate cyclase domain-containing protein [Bacteroidota bacterium]
MNWRLTPKAKRNISRIIPFGVIWFSIAVLFMITDLTATGFKGARPQSIALTPRIVLFAIISLTAIGIIVGTIEILLGERRFRKLSLTKKIVYKFLIYGTFLFTTVAITYPIALVMDPSDERVQGTLGEEMISFFTSSDFVSTAVQLGFSLLMSLFYTTISESLGHNALLNLFTGRYHTPKVEQRIFMFLDMKDSTKIAEQLGHLTYFDLLQQYYEAMSDPIVNHLGEVYQYIGDEVVVSWKLERGLRNSNCLRTFFAIKASLADQQPTFYRQYGFTPDFKAGLHLGEVTIGEIGALKKEVVFTGDVLNTTARLQALCSSYESDLIISQELIKVLDLDEAWEAADLGSVQLKGKSQETHIFSIRSLAPASSKAHLARSEG